MQRELVPYLEESLEGVDALWLEGDAFFVYLIGYQILSLFF
jgi:hypothetical protein